MKINKLNIKQVETAKATLGDGGGLYFKVDKLGHRKWVFRYTLNGKVNEMGLGGSLVSLATARKLAVVARENVALGLNPATARREKHLAGVSKPPKPSFWHCALALIKSKQSAWRSEKHRSQWRATLETQAAPLRGLPVDEVDTEAVLGVLQPVWQATPETASRLRGRIEAVLDYAKAHGWRSGENPAAWRGHLALILPKRGKLSRGHHAAMAYAGVPAFMAGLREKETMPSLALQFLILTAARLGEALGARWTEFDLDTKVWTIPGDRMKAGVAHRVPLSSAAMAILDRMAGIRTGDFVFAGQRRGSSLSNGALRLVVPDGVTVHGFRSSFRDWCGNETSFPREIAEGALAHRAGDATEQAYRRGDALEKRRALMDAWANFCEAGGKIVQLRAVV
jgi:integrase